MPVHMPGFNLLVRRGGKGTVHGPDACRQADANDSPWVHGHQTVAPSALMQSPCGDGDYADAQARVHESLVQVASFKRRHPTILPGLSVED